MSSGLLGGGSLRILEGSSLDCKKEENEREKERERPMEHTMAPLPLLNVVVPVMLGDGSHFGSMRRQLDTREDGK